MTVKQYKKNYSKPQILFLKNENWFHDTLKFSVIIHNSVYQSINAMSQPVDTWEFERI